MMMISFFRERCINKLNTTAEADNVFAVLDCVLDDRFKELKIRIPVSSDLYLPFLKLISIVACRSPALEQLEVHAFAPITLIDGDLESCSMASNAPRLMCLKKLVIRNGVPNKNFSRLGDSLLDGSNRSVFSLVGQFCPALTELTVDGFCPKMKDFLGLILGELVDTVLSSAGNEKWFEDLPFKNFKFAPEFTSSLCSTLQILSLKKSGNCKSYCYSIIDVSTSAFVLRNLPALICVKFKGYSSIQHKLFGHAIKHLRDHRDTVDEKKQQEFNQVCGEARIILFGRNAVTSPVSHSGIGIF